jgi:RNA polymerase sigma-70 factor (ECF subfamily)
VTLSDVFIRRSSQKKELTDDELMRQVQRGDNNAFRILYDRYKGQMFIYCLRMIGDRDAAKDVLQEIFIRVLTHRERYEPGTNFVGWVHTIARNLCLNVRRDAKDHASFDETMSYGRDMNDPESDVALQEQLAAEIARLPEIYREALVLREYEGHSYQEIVTITGLTMSTVKFRIFKAREILRERLAWGLDELRGTE